MVYEKKLFIRTIILTIVSLLSTGGLVFCVDPYVHFRKPLSGVSYWFSEDSARFENDGILRNYDYNALITGSSMTQNFLASEFDNLFDVSSVKVSISGASFREINEQCRRAVKYNEDLKYILRGVDFGYIMEDKDFLRYENYPDYLYDGINLNDVNYIFDKRALRVCLYDVAYTFMHRQGTTMDDYQYWGKDGGYAKIEYEFDLEEHIQESMTDVERNRVEANISQNITSIADDNPEIIFIYYVTPYSICVFDQYESLGELEKRLEAEHMLIRECIKRDNVEIFSFLDCEDIICDLNNYSDKSHYKPEINSMILEFIHSGEHRITCENYDDYCEQEEKLLFEKTKYR